MKEDLNMFGLQLNYATTAWSVGYVIGQIPGNMLLNRVSPHYIVFVMEFGWSILTLCTTWVKTWEQLVAIRFFVGLFESAYYPGLRTSLTSLCTDSSLLDRIVVYQRRTWKTIQHLSSCHSGWYPPLGCSAGWCTDHLTR